MSLVGKRIWVTRPAEQSGPLMQLLIKEDAYPIAFPLFSINPLAYGLTELKLKAQSADWIIFVSPSAIDTAWPVLSDKPPNARLATVGMSSAKRLAKLVGQQIVAPSSGSGSQALLDMPILQEVVGQRILILRGEEGRNLLPDVLAERGALVTCIGAYRRVELPLNWQCLAKQPPDAIVLTSSDMVDRFFNAAGPGRFRALQYKPYCVPHPRIAERLKSKGVTQIMITQASDESLVAGLKAWFLYHP